jgi:hypothetical protein
MQFQLIYFLQYILLVGNVFTTLLQLKIEKILISTDEQIDIKHELYCSRSQRRAANGSKRMYLDCTHGLFIT